MNSSSTITTTTHFHSSSSCFKILRERYNNYETRQTALKFKAENFRKKFSSLKIIQNSFGFGPTYSPSKLHAPNPSFAAIEKKPMETEIDELVVADKLQLLVLEFKTLEEPMDRVKRLLQYAANLPPYDESARVPENRVLGCATQVWVEAEMNEFGRMRFRADSDSEISKGFCSCLVWMLDGAEPEEVLGMKTEDLGYVNVGLYVRANSRVNTWHNVLISMQKRTKALVTEREGKTPLMDPLPSFIVSAADQIAAKSHGSSAEAQIQTTRWKELDANLSLF